MPAAAGAKRKRAPAKGKAASRTGKTSEATGKKRTTSVAPGPTRSELDGKGLTELRALCTDAKLSTTGGKDAIVRRLLEHLRRVFGGGGHVGAFLGRGEAPAPYGVHWDQTENLCFQLVGNRRWQVRRPSIPDNHYALLAEDGEAGEIVWDGVLAAGQSRTGLQL